MADRAKERNATTFAELVETFLSDHAQAKRKPRTAKGYEDILTRIVIPRIGARKVADISRADLAKIHLNLQRTPVQADNMLTVVGTVYAFGSRRGLVPEGMNPAKGIERYGGTRRERFLSDEELGRLGSAIREAETVGVPWVINRDKPGAKHLPKDADNRRNRISAHAAAALRLLILTGCRLREILHAQWANVDLGQGILKLPDHKTIRSVGPKTVVLNAPAIRVLSDLERVGPYIVTGDDPKKPRADLKRPWMLVSKRAGLNGVRIHDLRHTHASVGAGSGIGLQLVGKLLGHSSPQVTARYAHVADDPLRRASNRIGARIAAAMGETGKPAAAIAKLRQRS
jgi:integrase